MKRATILAIVSLGCAVALPLAAQQPPAPLPPLTQKLGVGPEFIVGVLPNGLHYSIRKNAEPAKRAELRLAVNAGSILEDSDQLGYAHFVEHTAFDGTTHFKKNDLIKYLESTGVRFGADLNAYTGFDETVYQLSVPTDTTRLLETAFLILEDWAHGQVFDSTAVVNERGVVLEEWRAGLGATERMRRSFIPIVLKDSKYATHLPIGTDVSIQQAQPSVLRRFYQDWYRPDLMAVVAVGDFDVAQVESMIKQHFGAIPRAAAGARPRVAVAVPDNTTPLIAITSDVEATASSVTIGYKHPRKIVATFGDYRTQIAEGLYSEMLNARLREVAQQPDAPFLSAAVGVGPFFARDVSGLFFTANVKDGGVERGAEAVLTEARRVDQFGFLPSELQRAKDNTLRRWEQMYAERNKTSSRDEVGELVRNFLDQEDIPGVQAEYDMVRRFVPEITVADVNNAGRAWIRDEDRVALITVPKKAGVAVPTEAQILAMFDRVSKVPVTAYTESVTDQPLLDRVPAPGKVVNTRTIDVAGVTEWKLSNGARVLVKPTDFKADEVLFSAYSPGGTSVVSDADYMSASQASAIVQASGVGKLNATDLGKKLAGKAANVTPTISATTEGLAGNASPRDLETLFQLVYLRFTAPRLDTAAWLAMRAQLDANVANRGANPQFALRDTIAVTMTQHNVRARPLSAATLAEINPQRALEIYKDRFSNAGDFTFVFVGNVTLDLLKPLVEKYLASLPSTGRVESWRDVGDSPPSGVVEKVLRKGTAPQSITVALFTGPFVYKPETRVALLGLTTLAQMWLTDALRQEMGGTYSPNLNGSGSKIPRSEYTIQIAYTSSPDNVDRLWARTMRVIDSLRNVGPNEADLAKVKEQFNRTRETSLKQNAYWMAGISQRDQSGEDIGGLMGAYDELVKNLTARRIQEAAQLYLDSKRFVKFVLLPEK